MTSELQPVLQGKMKIEEIEKVSISIDRRGHSLSEGAGTTMTTVRTPRFTIDAVLPPIFWYKQEVVHFFFIIHSVFYLINQVPLFVVFDGWDSTISYDNCRNTEVVRRLPYDSI